MSLIERRYRRTLRLLPAWYRDRWADEMVSSFMEGSYAAEPDRDLVEAGRPRLAESLSVATLALRLRLGGDGAPPRALAWREAWRRVALLTLMYAAGASAVQVGLLVTLILDGRFVRPDGQIVNPHTYWLSYATPLFQLPWLVAFGLLVVGRLRAARDFAVTATVLSMAVPVVSAVFGEGPIWTYTITLIQLWAAVPAIVLVVLSIAAPSVEPVLPRPVRAAWFGGFGVALVALVGLSAMMRSGPDGIVWDSVSTLCAVLILATLGVLAAGLVSGRPSAPWLLALAVVGAGSALIRWLTLFPITDAYVAIGTAVTILAAAAAGLAAATGLAALRREAPSPTGPTGVGG
jgi:hypothetical protein